MPNSNNNEIVNLSTLNVESIQDWNNELMKALHEIVNLSTLNVESIQDWNKLIPVVKAAFLMMNGEDKWFFHYDELMKALLGCDFPETKKHCRLFFLDYQKGE